MDQRKLNELLEAAKKGDYSKLEEVKSMVSEEDYQKALNIFNQYSQKSEEEILKELGRLKHLIPNQQEIIDQMLPFLDEEQKAKLDRILEILEGY
ncbi:hypothetical protein [Clostridium formicaceticum]|uniref:Uncharacterized protein n=1 Tax=Clostridium formicaceticum TaxID=1497 RepID=A0AAC9RJ91_9CLOT|nr:hypothetical protein [Clostridium formicaceticum]AOY76648.1 hypothetical protein BJL90_12700 [Clostridium formicaceticum]ARE87071.1 hypothetical protein CLFO_14570 [Clostridium formicaceticum]